MLLKDEHADPRVTRTRKLLADALEHLLAEKSFDDVTVGAIATHARVNRATFYAHFTDKHAMVDDLFREHFAEIVDQRIRRHSGATNEMARGLFLALTDHWSGVNAKCRPTYRRFASSVEHHVVGFLRDWVYEWLVAQSIFQHVSERRLLIAAGTISGAIYGAALEWRKQAGTQSATLFADEAIGLIVASVAALKDEPQIML